MSALSLACQASADGADGADLGGLEAADEDEPTGNAEGGDPGDDSSAPEDQQDPNSTGFVPDDDVISVSTCDPFFQDCEPGQKCVPYASTGGNWDANKCVEVLGDGVVGEPCTYDGAVEATDSCDANSLCWNVGDVDGEAIGTCSAFCSGTPDDPFCSVGSSCSISCDGSLNVCVENCDPIAQDCLGLGCYWSYNGFNCIFTAGEGIDEGEPCGFINDCKPGLMCANGEVVPGCEGSACCSTYCDLDAPDCTTEGTGCVAFFEDGTATPGFEHVGICIDPEA